VRIISASHRDLNTEVDQGSFRQDLFYRLQVFAVRSLSLRQRPDDILPLAHGFLERFSVQYGKGPRRLTPAAEEAMLAYAWPGNVRELQNEIQRVLVLAPGRMLGADLLDPRILRASPFDDMGASGMRGVGGQSVSLKARVEALESSILRETLIRHRWNKTQAAEELGLSRVGLRAKLERYGLLPSNGAGASTEDD